MILTGLEIVSPPRYVTHLLLVGTLHQVGGARAGMTMKFY